MKVKILSREIEIILIEHYQEDPLGNQYQGRAILLENKIYAEKNSSCLESIIHELKHFYRWFVGYRGSLEEEEDCEMTARFATQLIRENGLDIFERLWKYANT